ncbi:MAG TPA: serine hydrolase domain-containing protein [Pyrinomonadaceae bacterium]|nr:serine hydrolase domain-containing protein [Pyrinomonadaceae bacterium]
MKHLIRPSILLAIVLLASSFINAQPDNLARFRETYVKELKEAAIVGSSFVFLKDNKVVAEEHYGLANIEKNQPVNADTIYHWASNTKPFTGIAIMQLRDRGLLKLDDPVTKYLPELRDVHNRFGSMDDITIRHLMTHSAGFRNSTWPWDEGKDWEPFEPTDYSQLVAMLPFTEILFKPGSKFSYSNPGIIFLGRIIEKLTGDDYEVYVDKNILKPLEMYHSYFDATPYHLLKYRSHSYYIDGGKRTEGRFDANTGITVSNSGLNSPIADMVKYLNFLTGDPKKQSVYDGILKRTTLEEMWKPQLPTTVDANGNAGFTTDIGLIYFLNRRDGHNFLGHGGDQNGFISYIDFEPSTRKASVIVFNTNVIYPANTPPEKDVVSRLRNAIRTLY